MAFHCISPRRLPCEDTVMALWCGRMKVGRLRRRGIRIIHRAWVDQTCGCRLQLVCWVCTILIDAKGTGGWGAKPTSWSAFLADWDSMVMAAAGGHRADTRIRLLTGTVTSPSLAAEIEAFRGNRFPQTVDGINMRTDGAGQCTCRAPKLAFRAAWFKPVYDFLQCGTASLSSGCKLFYMDDPGCVAASAGGSSCAAAAVEVQGDGAGAKRATPHRCRSMFRRHRNP